MDVTHNGKTMSAEDWFFIEGFVPMPAGSYADWEIGPGDRHRHVEAEQVIYEGTSGDCPICAHPLIVVDPDDAD